MSAYATLVTRATALVNDTGGDLTSPMFEDAFREALTRYDGDVPLQVVEDLSGDGSTYDFALTSWVDHFSSVVSVEYPAGYRPAALMDASEYTIYRTESTNDLRLQTMTPGATETVRVTYTARHTISGLDAAAATTVYGWHEEAIVCLAASRLLIRLADKYLHEQGGSMLAADGIDRNSKSDIARRLANSLEKDYRDYLDIESGVMAAGTVVDWDTTFAGSGLDMLTHPKVWR